MKALIKLFNAPLLLLLKRRKAINERRAEQLQKVLWGLCTKTVVLESIKNRTNPHALHIVAPNLREDLKRANQELEDLKVTLARLMGDTMHLNIRIQKLGGAA